jgi:hypothetical protein
MMPPTIYGRGTGFFNKQSIQLPFVIRRAIKAGHPEYLGDGSGTVGYVHIKDLAQLYELLLAKVLQGAEIPFNRKGIYFSNTGEFTWKIVSSEIGEIGVQLNALESAEPVSISLDIAEHEWESAGSRLILETNYAGRFVRIWQAVETRQWTNYPDLKPRRNSHTPWGGSLREHQRIGTVNLWKRGRRCSTRIMGSERYRVCEVDVSLRFRPSCGLQSLVETQSRA